MQNNKREGDTYLWVVRDLRVSSPSNLARRRHNTQIRNIYLDNGTLGQDSQLGIQRVAGVFLDAQDRQLNCDVQRRVRDVGLLVTQTHRTDKSFVLDGTTCEIGSNESRLGDDSLPRFLGDFLARLDDLEELLLGNTLDLGDRNRKSRGFLGALVLDLRAEGLCRRGVGTVEKIGGHGVGRFLFLGVALDVALFVLLDLLAHLDLLVVPLFGVELGPQAAQVLGILGLFVAFTGGLFARALFGVETLAVELLRSFCLIVRSWLRLEDWTWKKTIWRNRIVEKERD